MNRSKTFHTFALLTLIILSTVGVVILLGLQLAPIAREIMGQGATNVGVSALATARPAPSPTPISTTVSSPPADATLLSTPVTPLASATSSLQINIDSVDVDAEALQDVFTETVVVAVPTHSAAVAESLQQRAVVDAAVVNVRSAPSIVGELLAQVPQDTELQILDHSEDGEWYLVCCPLGTTAERESWVSAELLRLLPSPAEQFTAGLQATVSSAAGASTEQRVTTTDPNVVTGVVNVALVNIRSGPSTQYEVVGQVNADSLLTITGRNEAGDWVQVCCPVAAQESGWISAQFLDIGDGRDQVLGALPRPPIPPLPTTSPPSAAGGPNRTPESQAATGTGPGLPGSGTFGAPGGTNPLTGQGLAGGRSGQRPVIVCINNDPAARPQLGLSQADVVYEYLMEGYGITRFSAIFYGENVGQIGPVRSARLINYYMGALYDAGLVCSGASDGVRYALKHEAPFPYLDIDLDDPSNTRYSISVGTDYRTRLRTGTEGAHRWLSDWGVERSPNLRGFTFGAQIGGGAPATQVTVPYPGGTGSQVQYRYDGPRGQYLRWLGGTAHTDGNTGQQLAVENIIVQYVTHEATDIVEDSLGSTSIRLNLFGSGQAYVFRDGAAYLGTWRSESRGDLPRFYTNDGAEVTLKPGKSWISIVPTSYSITYQ